LENPPSWPLLPRQGRTSLNDKRLKVIAGLHAWVPPQNLTPIAPQRGFQSLLLLIPAGFFGLRSLFESFDLGLDDGGPLRVLLLGLVQRSLRLVDRLLTPFTLLLPGGLFLRPFKLAAPPFPFVVESGLSFRNLIDGARGRLLRPWAFRL